MGLEMKVSSRSEGLRAESERHEGKQMGRREETTEKGGKVKRVAAKLFVSSNSIWR